MSTEVERLKNATLCYEDQDRYLCTWNEPEFPGGFPSCHEENAVAIILASESEWTGQALCAKHMSLACPENMPKFTETEDEPGLAPPDTREVLEAVLLSSTPEGRQLFRQTHHRVTKIIGAEP